MPTPDATPSGVADAAAELAALRAENERLRAELEGDQARFWELYELAESTLRGWDEEKARSRRWRRRALREREKVRAARLEPPAPVEEAIDGEGALARILDAFCEHPDAQRVTCEIPRWDDGRVTWEETDVPWARVEGRAAWALILAKHSTPGAAFRAIGVPIHITGAAAELAASVPEPVPCDACSVPCVPVEARGFNLCPSCAEGDPRRVPGWAILSWAWRFLRSDLGRPPKRAELRAFVPQKNPDTIRRWWEAAGPTFAEWRRVEATAGKIILDAIPPRNDAEEALATLRGPRSRA